MSVEELLNKQIGGGNRMEIDPMGAKIAHLELDGITLLSLFTRGDGKQGATHPCTPNFGPETNTSFSLPHHGPMRNSKCTVTNETEQEITLRYEIQAGTYPKGVVVEQRFMLEDKQFTLITTHTNTDSVPAPVNFGEHFYWAAPEGWQGVLFNGKDITDAVKGDTALEIQPINSIVIPSQPEIILRQEGFTIANVWAYHNTDTDQYDQTYVCVEPVEGKPKSEFFGSQPSLLQPGQSRETKVVVSI